jgi:type IV secretion system protein VirD4
MLSEHKAYRRPSLERGCYVVQAFPILGEPAAAGNVVMRFDPGAAEGSVGFNLLQEIRLDTVHEVGDVQNLVTILVDPDGKGLVDHWAKTAHAFLTGAILHVLYKCRAEGRIGALPDVAAALSDLSRAIEELYREMRLNRWGTGDTMHPTIAAAARDMENRPPEERGSVLSTAMSFLSLYRDPLVAKNVARSDFLIHDLMNYTSTARSKFAPMYRECASELAADKLHWNQ